MPSKMQTAKTIRPIKTHLAPQTNAMLRELKENKKEDLDIEALSQNVIEDAIAKASSDIHLQPQSNFVVVRFRIDGAIHDVASIPEKFGKQLIRFFKTMAKLDPVTLFHPQDGRAEVVVAGKTIDIRFTFAPCINGESTCLRLLEGQKIRFRLNELGLREQDQDKIEQWLNSVSGMFLVSGPTGSGKTTLLYTLLHELKLLERNILTIEDPIEYQIDGVTQMQVDSQNDFSFIQALKGMLRMDPDYLLLGEIRDEKSAEAAIDASNTGRVLLSTLHSRDAIGAITSLRNFGVKDHEIAASLEVVVSQRLVRRLCNNCKTTEAPKEKDKLWLKSIGLPAPEKTCYSQGCENCRYTGYSGRIGVFEVFRLTEELYEMILDHADEGSMRRKIREVYEVPSTLEDGLAKVEQEITSLSEVRMMGGQSSFVS